MIKHHRTRRLKRRRQIGKYGFLGSSGGTYGGLGGSGNSQGSVLTSLKSPFTDSRVTYGDFYTASLLGTPGKNILN